MARFSSRGASSCRFAVHFRLLTALLGFTAILSGCGGGGGGYFSPAITAQPVATDTQTTLTSAISRAYSPNYASQITSGGVWSGRTFRLYCPTDNDAEIAFAALDQWNNATGHFFAYERTETAAEAQVTFSLAPQSEFASGIIGTTHYTFDRDSNELTSAQVRIATAGTVENQVRVAKHEFGHVFGIHGHSASEGDLMFSAVSPASVLTERDANTLYWLYRNTPPVATSSGRSQVAADTLHSDTIVCPASP